jgi:RNA polymerase sigma-70 factor, ECF subfamily
MAMTDEQRFERVYREHYSRVASYLLSRADRDAAQDALARTFEVAWRRFAAIPDEPLPWLLGVARNVLSELRRAEGRRDALIERIAAGARGAADDHADVLARRELAKAALACLSDEDREVLLLIAWDGLSQRDAAAALGCSRAAYAMRLHRARARLHSALSEIAESEPPATRPPPAAKGAAEPDSDTTTSHFVKETT